MDKQSVHLPADIIEHILSRLPVKSLARFRCVSKSWRRLIFCKRFIKSHLQISSQNPTQVILDGWRSDFRIQCSVEWLLEEILSERPMEIPMTGHAHDLVMGSCNGLVCFYSWANFDYILWNPSTNTYKKLPALEYDYMTCREESGFGWDESSDDYKVVVLCFGYSDNPNVCKVYSSKRNSWKAVEMPDFRYGSDSTPDVAGKCVDGKLHWHVARNGIICFDLKSEEIGMMECAPGIDDSLEPFLYVGVVAGCLSLITREVPRVWVMKEYGVKESWFKLSRVRELLEPPFSASFVVGPNSEIMLFDGPTFIVFLPRHLAYRRQLRRRVSHRQLHVIISNAHVFIPSLVPPGVGRRQISPQLKR